jgi:hypothetical protein
MMLLAGWAVYELTAQPGLAALVTCVKFGWADLRTALWLRRVDPDRYRGWTCFWSYLAFGLWKVAIMAGILVLSLLMCEALFVGGRGRQVGLEILLGSLLAAGVGLGSSFLMTYLALFSALRNGVRIWMGAAPRLARRERFWPPRHGGVNAAPVVFVTTLVVTFFLVMLVSAKLLSLWNPGAMLVGFFVGLVLTSLVCLFGGYVALSQRLVARSPHECWTCDEDEEAYQLDLSGSAEDRG